MMRDGSEAIRQVWFCDVGRDKSKRCSGCGIGVCEVY